MTKHTYFRVIDRYKSEKVIYIIYIKYSIYRSILSLTLL